MLHLYPTAIFAIRQNGMLNEQYLMHVEKATQDTGLQNIHLMGREKKKKKIDNMTVLTTLAKHNNINY